MVRKRLQSSQTSIHLAVDMWTSPSHDLLLAICASFVGARDRFRNVLIALRTGSVYKLANHGCDPPAVLRPMIIMEEDTVL